MSVSVIAPARLHFGLVSPGPAERRFGGCGVMLDQPPVEIAVEKSHSWKFGGRHQEKARTAVEHWLSCRNESVSPCHVDVRDAPPLHVGLGVGTQLSLAIAAGLFALFEGEIPTSINLAANVQRGKRSAIGTHGFDHGGFIVDGGKSEDDVIAELDFQVDLPEEWHWVLVQPSQKEADLTMHGQRETELFCHANETPLDLRQRMIEMLRLQLVPAAVQSDFDQFSTALFEYGFAAGLAFEKEQGGAFNGESVSRLVQYCRTKVKGVGQSSWGPTVFTLHASESAANEFAANIRKDLGVEPIISKTNRGGATVS